MKTAALILLLMLAGCRYADIPLPMRRGEPVRYVRVFGVDREIARIFALAASATVPGVWDIFRDMLPDLLVPALPILPALLVGKHYGKTRERGKTKKKNPPPREGGGGERTREREP